MGTTANTTDSNESKKNDTCAISNESKKTDTCAISNESEKTDAFAIAAVDSKKLTEKPNSDELLVLYSLYKIATGEDITKAPEPSKFDLKGKSKRKAWQAKVETGITQEEAKAAYIALVERLKVDYKYDPNKVSETIGG